MGYMSGSNVYADYDGDGIRDGVLRELNIGNGLNGTLINGVLSLEVTGGGGSINDGTITLTAGTNISGGGDFTTNQLTAEEITFDGLSDAEIRALFSATSPISLSGGVISFTGGLNDLSDVTITSASTGDSLSYNGSAWVNGPKDLQYIQVRNNTGGPLSKGQVVYVSANHNSNVVDVDLARANSASTMPAIGVLYQDLADEAEGLAVAFGKANGVDLDPVDFNDGDVVYVSEATAGAVTSTKPTGASELIQNVGIVMQTHATNGVLYVTGVGRSNDVPNTISISGGLTAGSLTTAGAADLGPTTINGKLTVTGLIDPTGLELTPVAANPGGVAANTIWQDSANSNQWKIGANRVVDAGNIATIAGGAGFVTDISGFDTDDLSEGTTNRYFANSLARAAISVGTPAAASGSGSISYVSGTGVLTYTPPDLSSYLTSYTETNDLTAAVTWANVPDANITQSSVTQHQAALSITESQISDLQTYSTATGVEDNADVTDFTNVQAALSGNGIFTTATVQSTDYVLIQDGDNSGDLRVTPASQIANLYTESNDLTAAVTWANVPDANITESSVTQHQAALSITESQISDLQSYHIGTLAIADGGTGATTAAGARTSLGVDPAGTDNSTDVTLATVTGNYLTIAGQVITAGVVPLSLGGTGSTTASGARTALGLGTAATTAATDYATAAQGTKADTAHSWGDHASAGYLTSLGTALVDADFGSAGLMKTDGAGGYSVITDASANWDTAYGWGDHASAGYLTSVTETDTLDTVVGRGSSTATYITVGGITADTNTLVTDIVNNRVGIGTAGPAQAFHVVGSIRQTGVSGSDQVLYADTNGDLQAVTIGTGLSFSSGTLSASGAAAGTVTSVDMSVPTGFAISGNPITSSGTLALAFDTGYSLPTDAKQTNWDTAFGWGDHAGAGYLTSETYTGTVTSVAATVPTGFTVSGSPVTSTGTIAIAFDTGYSLPTTAKQTNWDTAFGWGDHAGAGYLTSFSESDPVFTASPAGGITAPDIANWNTAFAWGDHAGAGYLTSLGTAVVDADFGTAGLMKTDGAGGYSTITDASANWDTAYGWGDHSAAGYVTTTEPDFLLLNLPASISAGTKASWNTINSWTVADSGGTAPTFDPVTGNITINTSGTYEMIFNAVFRHTSGGWGLTWSSAVTHYLRLWVTRGPTAELGPVGTMAASSSMPAILHRVVPLNSGDIVNAVVYWNFSAYSSGMQLFESNTFNLQNYVLIRRVDD